MSDISTLNGLYKLESLSLLPDYCLQEIFSREINNTSAAKIIFLLSESSRHKILSNFNQVRSDKINTLIADYDSGNLECSFSSFENNCEALLDRVQQLKESGIIMIPEVNLDDSFFDSSKELSNFSDSLPKFNFYHNDLHDLISWWNLAAKNIKSIFGKRVQVENIILQRLDDEFSSKIFSHSIDDITDLYFSECARELHNEIYENYKIRLNLIEYFFISIIKGHTNKSLAENLGYSFHNDEEFTQQLIKHGPLLLFPAIKDGLPTQDIAMSLYKLKLIFEEDGIDEIDKLTTNSEEYFFKKSLSITKSEMTADYALQIISERKKAQLLEIETKLKMITDAATCIRKNISPYIMLELMSSYTVYDFEE